MAGSDPSSSGVLRVPAEAADLRTAAEDAAVSVYPVGPSGLHRHNPLVTATRAGQTAYYPNCTPERMADVAEELAAGSLASDSAVTVVSHNDVEGFPVGGLAGLEIGVRRVLEGAGWRRPSSTVDHRAAGGFVDTESDAVLNIAAELHGRGWGDWQQDEPVVNHWRALHDDDRSPAIVINAHADLDAFLCESVPFEPLEGACLAARATDAARIVVYLSVEEQAAIERVREAVETYPEPPTSLTVETGPGVYRAAEPTMALEALEGNHRLEARLRTPGRLPTLAGRPALVHSARTFAHLAVAARTNETPTTRLTSVVGDVESPATVELSADDRLSSALDAAEPSDGFKAAAVGGRFGGLTDSLDLAPTLDALTGADLGTEGTIEVLGDDRCVLSFIGRRASFAADANCGRCVPCREGSTQLAGLLRDVYDGGLDREGIAELVRTMTGASLCTFGVAAGRPVRTALASFEAEVAAHADGQCPTGACEVT